MKQTFGEVLINMYPKALYMAFVPAERLHLGAEAEVWSGTWMGLDAVRKLRRPRKWRHPDLDHRLGYRRMMSESRLLIRLKRSGVNVPTAVSYTHLTLPTILLV